MSSPKTIYRVNNFLLVKKVLPFCLKYKSPLTFCLVCVPIVALLQAVQPFLLKEIIDLLTIKQSFKSALLDANYLLLLLFFCLLVIFCLRIGQSVIIQSVGQKVISDIRVALFEHLQSLPISFFEKNPVGKLLTRLTNDVEALSEMLASGLIGGLNDLLSLLGIVLFMFLIDWRLTLFEISLIPSLFFLTKFFEYHYRKANLESRNLLAQLNSIFQESLNGIGIIKLFSRESNFAERYRLINQNYVHVNNKYIVSDASFSALIELIGFLAIVLLLVVGALLKEAITPGKVVAFITYAQMMFTPVRNLSEKFAIFQAGFTSIERFDSLLSEKSPLLTQKTLFSDSVDSYLLFRDLSFTYPGQRTKALDQINLFLEKGESLGIIGKTGSGKSTLIKLLARFYDPSKGKIYFKNQDLRSFSLKELRRQILMVPQRNFIFSGSLRENLLLSKKISEELLHEKLLEFELSSILELFPDKLETKLQQGGKELSSGQRQLVSLTRAIIQDPAVLILDEATSSLDSRTEQIFSRANEKILKSGKTVIVIAHRLQTVINCSKLIVLEQGQIIQSGSHQKLMQEQNGNYARLYNLAGFF